MIDPIRCIVVVILCAMVFASALREPVEFSEYENIRITSGPEFANALPESWSTGYEIKPVTPAVLPSSLAPDSAYSQP